MPNTVNIYVNKTDLGLNNVDNTSDLNKPISNATQTALNGKEDVANKSTNTSLGASDTLYPSQKAVKTYVDTAISSSTIPDATTTVKGKLKLAGDLGGTADSPTVPDLVNKDTITTQQYPYTSMRFDKKTIHANTGVGGTLSSLTGNISLWAGQNIVNVTSIILHNDSVEPTFSSDFEKSADSLPYLVNNDNIIICTVVNQFPIKIIYRIVRGGSNIYNTFLTNNLKGASNGLAELDGTGKVPSSQLPSFVDDVVDYATLSAFPVTGESGKIYVALDTNLTYRWSGSVYVEISPSLALGETSASAYRGDRGKIAYDHSLLTSGNPHNVTKSDVGLSNVVNSDTTTTLNITDSTNKRFVTDSQKTVLGNTSGTNTGDETQATIKTKLGAATTSVDGYLTSTDWNTFNGKQNALGFTAENVANKSTDLTASATKYPTVNAVNTGLGLKENTITAGTTSQYYRGDKTFQTLDKTAVGLGNCDNTSDVNKPISSATQTALDSKSDKNITLDRKTASYTLVANDNGKMIEMNIASANTLTINASLFSAGNQILVSQYGAGQTTITAGAGVTLRSSGGKLKTSAQYSLVTIIAINSTEFYIAGDLTA